MLCAYCSSENANTKDHVPPKLIFPKSIRPTLQNNLIKVPCCFKCNNHFGKLLDPYFKILLGFRIGADPESSDIVMKEYFNEMMQVLNNGQQKLKQKLSSQVSHVNPNVSLIMLTKENRLVMKEMGERIVKGLYSAIFRKPINTAKELHMKIFDEMKYNPNIFHHLQIVPDTQNIDNRVFYAEYALIKDVPNSIASIWRLTFFNRHQIHGLVYDEPFFDRAREKNPELLKQLES